MNWLVIEEDLGKTEYIAVVAKPAWLKLGLEAKRHTLFSNRASAIERARKIKEIVGAKAVRVFHHLEDN